MINIDKMDEVEPGACFGVYLEAPLTIEEKSLLEEYEEYLWQFKSYGYSIMHEFKLPVITKFENGQLLKTIGYIPEEEIYICGLVTPLFRSIEAILKHFGGYAMINVGDIYKEQPAIKGKCFEIRKCKLDSENPYADSYQLINWEMISNAFNLYDPPEIREIYSIQNFIKTKSTTHERL